MEYFTFYMTIYEQILLGNKQYYLTQIKTQIY